MKRIIAGCATSTLMLILFSCGETSNIGSSILQDKIEILMDSSFTVTGQSILDEPVQSKTTTQLLGIIEAKEYGLFKSEFVTQFMTAGQIATTGITADDIDSLHLIMAIPAGSLVGDSIIPMGLEVYQLNKQLPTPIYSDFDPTDYYDSDNLLASEIYACNVIHEPDSISSSSYRYIYVKMPVELGKYLYQAYLDNPASYLSPTEFTKIFPGIYVKNSFGSGRVVKIGSTLMRLFYHYNTTSSITGNDTIMKGAGNYYAVTPEIITNNDITYTMAESLQNRIDQGDAIISAPTGSNVELIFPAEDMLEYYRSEGGNNAIVNSLTMSLPATKISNSYGIAPPPYLLMVLKDKKQEFFMNNELPDNNTSFYATYDSLTGTYDFSDMTGYMSWLISKSTVTADDYTFILTPISLNMGTNSSGYYGSTTYLESVAPYVDEPAMTNVDLKKAKIILTISRQSSK